MDGDTKGFGRFTQSSTAFDLRARLLERFTRLLGADLPYDSEVTHPTSPSSSRSR